MSSSLSEWSRRIEASVWHRGRKEDPGRLLSATTIVKPRVSLDPAAIAAVAAAAVRGGLDLAKDDENLTEQTFCPMIPRVEAVMSALERVERRQTSGSFMPSMSLH